MTAPRIEVRDLTEADLEWVAQQEREIFGVAAWSAALIQEDFRYGPRRYRGALWSDDAGESHLVGYAVYGWDGDAFHLMNIAVAEDYRGRGIARALMDDFVAEAVSVKAHEAWLEVAVDNARALALYEAYGFETVRVRRRYYQPGDIDALVMRKPITLGP